VDSSDSRASVRSHRSARQHGGCCEAGGQKGLTQWLDDAKIRFHRKTVERVTVWAANAARSDLMSAFHNRIWMSQLAE